LQAVKWLGGRDSNPDGLADIGARVELYIDDCCHYTLAGNRLLADFIARAVVNAPAPRSLPNH